LKNLIDYFFIVLAKGWKFLSCYRNEKNNLQFSAWNSYTLYWL